MKAAVLTGPRKLEVKTIEKPEPLAGEVLVEVSACGICGSDLRYYVGENPWSHHTMGYDKPNPANMVLGHEVTGKVVELSPEADPALEGQLIAMLPFKGCGRCYDCRTGKEHLCAFTRHTGHSAGWDEGGEYNPGGMANFCRIWQEFAYELPEEITAEQGVFLDGLGVAVHAVKHAKVRQGDYVVVLGAGPIGLLIAQVAIASGARAVACADVYNKALEIAEEVGIDYRLDAREDDVVAHTMARTKGKGADVVFETTATVEGPRQAVEMTRRGGTVGLVAGLFGPLELRPNNFFAEKTITSCANFQYEDFYTGLELMQCGEVVVEPMITHRFPLSEVDKAFDCALRKHETGAFKVVILPD